MEKMAVLIVVVIFGVAAMCYATFRFIHNEIDILKTTLRTSKGLESRLCEEYVNSLLNQIKTAANKISELRAENLKLHSDLNLARIEIRDKNQILESEIRDKNRILNEKRAKNIKSGE